MDAKYLKDTVGIPLSLCLSEVCEKRPSDPIEYIAQWLYKHVDNVAAENERLQEEIELERQREEYRIELEKQECRRIEMERLAQEEEMKRLEEEARARDLAAAKAAAALETVTERDEPPPSSRLEGNDEEPSDEQDPQLDVHADQSAFVEQNMEELAEMEEEEEEEES